MAKGKGLNRQRLYFKLESGWPRAGHSKIRHYVSGNAFDGTAVELENDSVNQNTATIATLQLCLNKTATDYHMPLLGLCIGMLSTRGQNRYTSLCIRKMQFSFLQLFVSYQTLLRFDKMSAISRFYDGIFCLIFTHFVQKKFQSFSKFFHVQCDKTVPR